MDYMDCANMLYKQADTLGNPQKANEPVNFSTSGAAFGGAVGLAKGFGSNKIVGDKKMINPDYVPGTKKKVFNSVKNKKVVNPDWNKTGKKMIKTPFGSKVMSAAGNLKKNPRLLKGVGVKGLVGAGVGYLGGQFVNGLQETSNSRYASFIQGAYEKMANENAEDLLRSGAASKIIRNLDEKHQNSFLRDISCEVCDYKGKPTNKGLCPQCGATLGVDESGNYIPQMKPYVKYDGIPVSGITVAEQAQLDDVGVWAY